MKKWVHAATSVLTQIEDTAYQLYEKYNGDDEVSFDDVLDIAVEHLEADGFVEGEDFNREDVERACNQFDWQLGDQSTGWSDSAKSQCTFDFDLQKYDSDRIEGLIDEYLADLGIETLDFEFGTSDDEEASQCKFDFIADEGYDGEEISEAIIDIIDNEGGNMLAIDFKSLEEE